MMVHFCFLSRLDNNHISHCDRPLIVWIPILLQVKAADQYDEHIVDQVPGQ